MSPLRYRDDESSSTGTVVGAVVGAIAGFALGMFVAQRVGGFGGLAARVRRQTAKLREESATGHVHDIDDDELDELQGDTVDLDDGDAMLEERVLEAFRNDPILCERAVDIGSVGEGIIELAGWVETVEEAEHAVTLARGVPGVDTVVNRIAIGAEEERLDEVARRFERGDATLNEAKWEGQQVGTGRRRQGTSDEFDRHADPKVTLEERWLSQDEALRNAAEDTEGTAERRRKGKQAVPRGDRTGGAPVAPTGVPKGDHVARPREADTQTAAADGVDDGVAERAGFLDRP